MGRPLKDRARDDPYGVIGDPAFEFANAFRNPVEAADLVCDPRRARWMAHEISRATGHAPDHLLKWAAARTALAMAWQGAEPGPTDVALLPTLLSLAGSHPT